MPSIRIGLSTQFNLESEQVGIGTTNPTATLEVLGGIKAEGVAGDGGISTFREYQGFQQTQQGIANNIVIDNGTSGPFSSLAGDILITDETTISSGSTVEVGKTKTLTVTDRFAVPLGETNNRDNAPEAGTTRFNQDFGTLEFFDGNNWKTVNSYARGGAAGRAVFGGSGSGPYGNVIDYVTISTRGNAVDFGDRTYTSYGSGGFSSETRGIFYGGRSGASPNPNVNSIDYVTMASTGNAIDFGDFTLSSVHTQGCSSSTRGFRAGAYNHSNAIEYIEIATVGNGLDFGDLTIGRHTAGSCSSPTRGFVAGGNTPGDNRENSIDVWTMASKGNAVEFGQLISERAEDPGTASNHIKGIICGGYDNSNSRLKSIETLLLSTQGVNIDFGNLTKVNIGAGAASNHVSVVNGGGNDGSRTNTIELIIISSSGGSTDCGDLMVERTTMKACSDSHGGLGGF